MIRRRAILLGVASSVAPLGLWSAAPPSVGRAEARTHPRLPAGVTLRGVNHVGDYRGSGDFWAGLWTTWDWDGWVRPQLDDISSIGNAVRFFGNTIPVADGTISMAQYLGRWQQVLEYSATIGLLVYPCGGDFRHWGNTSWSSATDIYRDLAGLWSGYGNVIGVDITNEASDALKPPLSEYGYNQPEPAIELLTELGGIVHDAGVPMTHSRSIHSRDGWLDEYAADHLGDFLDFHVYYSPDVGDSLVTASTRWGEGKKLIVGEFGKNVSTASIDRVEYYDDVRAMCANDENCLGAFAWAAWDQGDLDSAKYGLFDQERNLRIDIGGQLKGFPVRRS